MIFLDYYQNLGLHGFKHISKNCEIPDFHLMVGTAENLASQPIVNYVDFMPKTTYNLLPDPEMSYEQIQENLASGTLTIDDFFANVEPLGDAIYKY